MIFRILGLLRRHAVIVVGVIFIVMLYVSLETEINQRTYIYFIPQSLINGDESGGDNLSTVIPYPEMAGYSNLSSDSRIPTVDRTLETATVDSSSNPILDDENSKTFPARIQISSTTLDLATDPTNRTSIEPVCKIPQLLVDDPLVRPYLKKYRPLKCTSQSNWIYTAHGRFYISSSAVERNGDINCTYIRIDRQTDHRIKEVRLGPIENGTELPSDVFKVRCEADGTRLRYENYHVGVPAPRDELKRRIDENREKLRNRRMDLNVYMYLMDSLSRVNFIRQCPKFYKLLTEKMGALVMEGFNIVGDGTPWMLIPTTTGHFQHELPEARRRFKNASYLDDWPLIFRNFSDAGYVTSFVEEMAPFTAYNYKLRGFESQPVDHYLRNLLVAEQTHRSLVYPYCMGDTPRSLVWCRFWRELENMYGPMSARHFSMLFSAELSHDDYNTVQRLDEHWTREFERLYDDDLLNNTVLILAGDHGRRFGPLRQTQSGKLEEKLPFLSVVLPAWFRRRFPAAYRNLELNRNRLITAFDLHATFLDILDFKEVDGGAAGNLNQRGISLFREIPAERTCAHAHIKPHFCSCLDWIDLPDPSNDSIVIDSARTVIDYFNRQLEPVSNLCANLTLDRIVWAKLLRPNDQMMAFKESIDFDNINQDLTANTTLQSIVYQLRFVTEPGGGDFEASVSYFLNEQKYLMSEDTISRLNAYNDQAQCVIKTHQHLRTFCYCRNS